jgi:threonine/homoserine/homoserine lactone efflux protein
MAMKINFLNPAPYMFWLTIGSSYILMGSELEAAIFIVCAIFSLCAFTPPRRGVKADFIVPMHPLSRN